MQLLGCELVTVRGVKQLVENINDVDIRSGYLKDLRTLNIRGCSRVDAESFLDSISGSLRIKSILWRHHQKPTMAEILAFLGKSGIVLNNP